VILTSFDRYFGTWEIFSSPGDSKLTLNGFGLPWNGHSKTFWTLGFELLGRNLAPLYFKTHTVAVTVLRGSWFWPTSTRYPGTRGIFSSPGDSKLTPDGLGLPWNGHMQKELTLGVGLLGRNIAPLHFKSERVAETALGGSWFWATLPRFAETCGIFSSPAESKLTPGGLSFQWNGHRQKKRTLGVELLGRNIAPLHFKTKRVAETALHASWFWATLARYLGNWGIFSSPGDSKLTPDGLIFQWNGHRQKERTLGVVLLGRNITPFHFKTERVAETALRASWFWETLARFAETCGIFSSPGDSKLTPGGLSFQWNWQREKKRTLGEKLLGRNIAPLHFKTRGLADTALHSSLFWATLARFAEICGIFSSLGESKLTPDGLSFQWNEYRQTERTLGVEFLGKNIVPLHFKTEGVAETALRELWFWATLARFVGTYGIFSRTWDSKLSPDGLSFQWNGQKQKKRTLGVELLGRNVAPLHFETERVAKTALRASWFWATLAWFAEFWGIFSSPGDSKLSLDGLSF